MYYYGDKLKFLRDVLEISQEELADKISVNTRTISYWEKEQRPITKKGLLTLIKELGVNPFWIMWDSSKFANRNLTYIESFIKEELPEEFRNKPAEIITSLYPNKNGEVEMFYLGNIFVKDSLNDFIYDEDDLKKQQ